MTLPHLLLVDDSEAILAYEKAALSGHYTFSTATSGPEALEKVHQIRPAAVLLDLSMPGMDGEEVLARMKADPELRRIPVVVVSTERHRLEATIEAGAAAFLAKPIRADALAALVARVLDQATERERRAGLAGVSVTVGAIELGIPIDHVRSVVQQPATLPLPGGPSYLSEVFVLYGEPVCVLDLARRLGVEHAEPIVERKLVVLAGEAVPLALCVDRVRDPEEFAAEDVTSRELMAAGAAGAPTEGALAEALVALVRTSRGPLPFVDPRALLPADLLRKLPELVEQAHVLDLPPAPPEPA